MNCQSMSTVPCFKSSNEVSDLLLLLDSQVELVVLFVLLLSWLMLPHPPQSTSYYYRGGPSVVLTLRVKLFAWQIHWQTRQCSIIVTSPSPTHCYCYTIAHAHNFTHTRKKNTVQDIQLYLSCSGRLDVR